MILSFFKFFHNSIKILPVDQNWIRHHRLGDGDLRLLRRRQPEDSLRVVQGLGHQKFLQDAHLSLAPVAQCLHLETAVEMEVLRNVLGV